MKVKLALAAMAVVALAACSTTPHQGHITGKHETPGYTHYYTWSTSSCVAYVSRSRYVTRYSNGRSTRVYVGTSSVCVAHVTHVYTGHDWVPARYYLYLVNSQHHGDVSVTKVTYDSYQVGDYYRG